MTINFKNHLFNSNDISLDEAYFGKSIRTKVIESILNEIRSIELNENLDPDLHRLYLIQKNHLLSYHNKFKSTRDHIKDFKIKSIDRQYLQEYDFSNDPPTRFELDINFSNAIKCLEIAIGAFFGFNDVEVYMIDDYSIDIFTIPMYREKYLRTGLYYDDISKKKLTRDQLLDTFIVDNHGLRLDRKKISINAYFYMNIGIFNKDITAGELTATLLHEIFHNFSKYMIFVDSTLDDNLKDRIDERIADLGPTIYGYENEEISIRMKLLKNTLLGIYQQVESAFYIYKHPDEFSEEDIISKSLLKMEQDIIKKRKLIIDGKFNENIDVHPTEYSRSIAHIKYLFEEYKDPRNSYIEKKRLQNKIHSIIGIVKEYKNPKHELDSYIINALRKHYELESSIEDTLEKESDKYSNAKRLKVITDRMYKNKQRKNNNDKK